MRQRWDIFCTVIDNFGDIGICWRLAKQLVHEHGKIVRLWVDDLVSFSCIAPQVDPAAERQVIQQVEIYSWSMLPKAVEPADVVIEAFACELPEIYVSAMLQMTKQPVWINLEYLSAESWVAQYHGLPSPHPRLSLSKTFFFPGFVANTGGLLREKDLLAQRDEFTRHEEAGFWSTKHLPMRKPGELRISLFSYDAVPIDELIATLSACNQSILLIVPAGRIAEYIQRVSFDLISLQSDTVIVQNQLTIRIIPFMEQADYDRLLWSCDINFVRGEDSFVRAQWAGKPFVWNIYPQTENAHWHKLNAFLDLYTVNMSLSTAQAIRDLWLTWNGGMAWHPSAWLNFLTMRESLMQHSRDWINQLLKQDDLATNLVRFVENKL